MIDIFEIKLWDFLADAFFDLECMMRKFRMTCILKAKKAERKLK